MLDPTYARVPANTPPSPAAQRVLDYLDAHGAGLAALLERVGLAAAMDVLASVRARLSAPGLPQAAAIRDAGILLDLLSAVPQSTLDRATGAPDLDAAYRWHLARLTDLVATLEHG